LKASIGMQIQHDEFSQGLSPLEKFLRLFAEVNPKEGMTSVLLLSNIFLILTAYYFIKPVREGWLSVSVIADLSKLEVKAYSAFAQSLLLVLILPVYALVTTRLTRRALITATGVVSGLLLIVFWCLQPGLLTTQVAYAGVAFYIFVGIFSVTLVAQFWSFAADLYGQSRGKRLFPLVAIGASGGAMVGSWAGKQLVTLEWWNAYDLILLALVPLTAAILLARWIDRRGSAGDNSAALAQRREQPAVVEGEGAFATIMQHRYLMATAIMVMLFNWVVASGDNILFGLVQQAINQELVGVVDPAQLSKMVNVATTAFYSDLYFWINLIGLMLQAFIVSRLVRLGGFGLLIMTTPLISLVAYLSMSIAPVIGIIKVMKVAENSSNYSIHNTARHMLWLPTNKAMMYQAKTTIETLFYRLGDVLAALTVLLGTRYWQLRLDDFLVFNIVLCALWVLVSIYLYREYKVWSHASVV